MFTVLTTVGQQSNLDLALLRFGAIVGALRTPDPANGTNFLDLDGVTVTATFCQQIADELDGAACTRRPTRRSHQPQGPGVVRRERHVPHRPAAPARARPGDDVSRGQLPRPVPQGRLRRQGRVVSAPALNQESQATSSCCRSPRGCGSPRSGPTPTAPRRRCPTAPRSPSPASSTTPPRRSRPSPTRPPDRSSGGTFDTYPMMFKSGSVTITVVAPGFAAATATISLIPSTADPNVGLPGRPGQPEPDDHDGAAADDADAAHRQRQPHGHLLRRAPLPTTHVASTCRSPTPRAVYAVDPGAAARRHRHHRRPGVRRVDRRRRRLLVRQRPAGPLHADVDRRPRESSPTSCSPRRAASTWLPDRDLNRGRRSPASCTRRRSPARVHRGDNGTPVVGRGRGLHPRDAGPCPACPRRTTTTTPTASSRCASGTCPRDGRRHHQERRSPADDRPGDRVHARRGRSPGTQPSPGRRARSPATVRGRDNPVRRRRRPSTASRWC